MSQPRVFWNTCITVPRSEWPLTKSNSVNSKNQVDNTQKKNFYFMWPLIHNFPFSSLFPFGCLLWNSLFLRGIIPVVKSLQVIPYSPLGSHPLQRFLEARQRRIVFSSLLGRKKETTKHKHCLMNIFLTPVF